MVEKKSGLLKYLATSFKADSSDSHVENTELEGTEKSEALQTQDDLFAQLKIDFSDLQAQNVKLLERAEKSEAELVQLKELVAINTQEQATVLENQVAEQQAFEEEKNTQLETLKNRVTVLEAEVSEKENEVNLQSELVTSLKTELANAQDESATMQSQLAEQEALALENKKLQERIGEVETRTEEAKELSVSEHNEELEKYKLEVERLKEELDKNNRKVAELLALQEQQANSDNTGISKDDIADILINAKVQAKTIIQAAQEQKESIVDAAKQEATDIVKATDERVELSKVQAENTIQEAEKQATSVIEAAEKRVSEASERLEFLKHKGDSYYRKLFELATDNSEFLRQIKEKAATFEPEEE
ncbi:hypothetical protein RyT2_11070 [Pseudolactococcus yaeyamensis]